MANDFNELKKKGWIGLSVGFGFNNSFCFGFCLSRDSNSVSVQMQTDSLWRDTNTITVQIPTESLEKFKQNFWRDSHRICGDM